MDSSERVESCCEVPGMHRTPAWHPQKHRDTRTRSCQTRHCSPEQGATWGSGAAGGSAHWPEGTDKPTPATAFLNIPRLAFAGHGTLLCCCPALLLREKSKTLSSAQKSELSLTPTGSRCALTARLHRGSSAVPLAAAPRGDPQERAPRAPENIGGAGAPGVPSTSALTIEMHRGSLAHALERGRSCKSPSGTSLGNTSAG